MPGEDPVRVAMLDPRDHRVEDRPSRNLCRFGFDEVFDDRQRFADGELPQLRELGLDGKDLPVLFVGRLAGVEEESKHGSPPYLNYSIFSSANSMPDG